MSAGADGAGYRSEATRAGDGRTTRTTSAPLHALDAIVGAAPTNLHDRHRALGDVAVGVEPEASEEAVPDARSKQLVDDRATGAVGTSDCVQEDLGGLGGVDGRGLDVHPALHGAEACRPVGRGGRQALGQNSREAEVHTAGSALRLLHQEWSRREPARSEEVDIVGKMTAEVTKHAARIRIDEAAHVHGVGSRTGDATGERRMLVRSRIPGRPPHDLEPDALRRCLENGGLERPVAGIAVVEHEDARPPTIAREQGERRPLEVSRREHTDEVANARRVQRRRQRGVDPGPRPRQADEVGERRHHRERAVLRTIQLGKGEDGARGVERPYDPDHVRVLAVCAGVRRALRLVEQARARDRVVAGLVGDAVRAGAKASLAKDELDRVCHLRGAHASATL